MAKTVPYTDSITFLPQSHGEREAILYEKIIQTFQSPEEDGIRQGTHSFCISCLNSKVIHSVKVEIHDLVSKSITTDCFHNPVINWYVLVQGVKQDVSCVNR